MQRARKTKKEEYYPLKLEEIKTWSTYENTCIELEFYVEDKKLMCSAKIYDGESFGGHRKDLRFTALIQLPDNYMRVIGEKISYAFDDYLENQYEEYLESEKKKWIQNLKTEILEK